MAVTTTHCTKLYNGNSVTTAFPVDFQFFASSDLIVTLISAAGAETVKALSTHYTVSGGQDANGLPALGTLTMLSAPATGERLRIDRNTPLTQSTIHTNNDAFPAKTVEAAYDRARLVEQENRLLAQRSVKRSLKDYLAGGELALPSPSADSLLGWNSAGNALENKSPASILVEGGLDGDGLFEFYDGATVRTIVGKMRDHFSGADVGMIADGSDRAAAFQELNAEIGNAIPSRIRIDLPHGIVKTTVGLVLSDKYVHVKGRGARVSELLFTGSGKLFDFTRTNGDSGLLMLSDFMADTDQADGNTFCYVETAVASGVSGGIDGLILRNIIAEAQGSGYWRRAIHSKNFGGIYADGFSAVNDNDSAAQVDTDTAAIFLENDNASVNVIRALHLDNFYLQRFNKAILSDSDGSIESVYVGRGEIIANVGILAQGSGGAMSAVHLNGTHFDCISACFKSEITSNVIRMDGVDMRVGNNGDDYAEAILVEVAAGESLTMSRSCQLSGANASNPNPVTAVKVGGSYSRAYIDALIRNCDVGILASDTAQQIDGNPRFQSVTTPFSITTSNAATVFRGRADALDSQEGQYTGDLDSLAGAAPGMTYRRVGAGATNGPSGATATGSHIMTEVWDANAARQVFLHISDHRIWTRIKTSGSWSSWGQMMGVITTAPRNIHSGGVPATQTADGTDTTPSVTETYIAEIFIPSTVTATGLALFNGSAASGNIKLGLANSAGALVAFTASTAQSGTDAYQRVPFSAPIILGPGTYYALAQFDDTNARFNSHILGSFGASKKTGETYGTFTTITPPTTFTTGQGPMASLY